MPVYRFGVTAMNCFSKVEAISGTWLGFFNLWCKEANDAHQKVALCLHPMAKDSVDASKTGRSQWGSEQCPKYESLQSKWEAHLLQQDAATYRSAPRMHRKKKNRSYPSDLQTQALLRVGYLGNLKPISATKIPLSAPPKKENKMLGSSSGRDLATWHFPAISPEV